MVHPWMMSQKMLLLSNELLLLFYVIRFILKQAKKGKHVFIKKTTTPKPLYHLHNNMLKTIWTRYWPHSNMLCRAEWCQCDLWLIWCLKHHGIGWFWFCGVICSFTCCEMCFLWSTDTPTPSQATGVCRTAWRTSIRFPHHIPSPSPSASPTGKHTHTIVKRWLFQCASDIYMGFLFMKGFRKRLVGSLNRHKET